MEFKMNNLDEVFTYLDKINDVENLQYLDSKWHSYDNLEWYKEILKKEIFWVHSTELVIIKKLEKFEQISLWSHKG